MGSLMSIAIQDDSMAALVEQAVRYVEDRAALRPGLCANRLTRLARSVEQELLTKLADRNAPSAEIAGLIQE